MSFYYENWKGKQKLTLKRGSAEWVNADTPSIYDDHGAEIFHGSSMYPYIGEFVTESGRELLMNFFEKSSIAFDKKYPDIKGCSTESFVKYCSGESL